MRTADYNPPNSGNSKEDYSTFPSDYPESDEDVYLPKQPKEGKKARGPASKSANTLNRLQTSFDVSPYDMETPQSATSSVLISPGSEKSISKRERSKNRTPRPSNSFILYRREKHVEIMAQYKGVKTLNNNVISKIVASMWRSETPEIKSHFAALADQEKLAHLLKYPDYKYRPRKSPTKKFPVAKKSSPTESSSPISPQSMPTSGYQSPHAYQPPMHWNMMHPSQPYQLMHSMDSHRLPIVEDSEIARGFEMMGNNRFDNPFEGREFLVQDSLLTPTEYAQNWPMSGNGLWNMGLDHP